MKLFLEKYETVLEGWYSPQVESPKQGEVVPHKKQVSKAYFYQRDFINDQEVFKRIELTKQMIVDLYNEIAKVENEVEDMPFYNDLPW